MSNESSHSPTVVFLPSGRRGQFPSGTSVLDAARQLGEPIESICGGNLACGKCQVRIEHGYFPKLNIKSSPEHVSPLTPKESEWLNSLPSPSPLRLACNAYVSNDVVVYVPENSRIHKQVIRKDANDITIIDVFPFVEQVYVKLMPPAQDDRRGDWERLQEALEQQWNLTNLAISYSAMLKLQDVLRIGNWEIMVVLWDKTRVLEVIPGYHDGIYGVAIDIGSTTIACYLCDLQTGQLLSEAAIMNPQIAYGEDLMSRISYASVNQDGLRKLNRSVIVALNKVIRNTAGKVNLSAKDIYEAVVVGNTTMISLFLNIHPKYLGEAPFTLANREAMDWPAAQLGLRLHPAANVHILPAEAGHVGADNVAVLLAENPTALDEVTLIIDVGTNAEIVLWDQERLYSASSPTGPAFEGAQISHGMRAAPGAIEHVRIDRATGAVRYKIIGEERWSDGWSKSPPAISPAGICGSGIIEAITELYLAGIILTDGRFNPAASNNRLIWEGKKGSFVLATEDETASGHAIVITQDDIRAIQLAKAALYAGCKVLMKEAGVDRIERIHLAGAFGSYISPLHALVLGLIPDAPLEHMLSVGNVAGDGARIALLNRDKRLESQRLARSVFYVETATNDFFQDAFVAAIHIPHQSDAFPHIAHLLPETKEGPRTRSRRTPRRKRK